MIDPTQKESLDSDQRLKRYDLQYLNLNLNEFKFKSVQRFEKFIPCQTTKQDERVGKSFT